MRGILAYSVFEEEQYCCLDSYISRKLHSSYLSAFSLEVCLRIQPTSTEWYLDPVKENKKINNIITSHYSLMHSYENNEKNVHFSSIT